jgi:hypothetical protein
MTEKLGVKSHRSDFNTENPIAYFGKPTTRCGMVPDRPQY